MDRMLRTPKSEKEWTDMCRALLRVHMTLTGTTAVTLSEALLKLGIEEKPESIRYKIWYGRYSAVFMLQCLRAMNVDQLVLPTDDLVERPPVRPRRRRVEKPKPAK